MRPPDFGPLRDARALGLRMITAATGMVVTVSDAVDRGTIMIHPRDYEDAFTERPTRTDFEMCQMMAAVRVFDSLVEKR